MTNITTTHSMIYSICTNEETILMVNEKIWCPKYNHFISVEKFK